MTELPQRRHPVHLPNIERHNQAVILFVTVCTSPRRAVLDNDRMHDLLRGSWDVAEQWVVGRYMIMPDHVHIFCSPRDRSSEGVKGWVGYWKRFVSRAAPDLQPIWLRDCWDTQLRDSGHYAEKWSYVALNPVRKGLVASPEDWPFQGEMNVLRW
jgi:putative transposase